MENTRQFVSTGFRVLLIAPANWEDLSDEKLFHVRDPATDTQFIVSGYANPGLSLAQWTEIRLQAVDNTLPFLRPYRARQALTGNGWQGMFAEYRGTFPGNDTESHYLLLCLLHDDMIISLAIDSPVAAYLANEAAYRKLIETQFLLLQVAR